ncbi:MAG TPA: hypothetical protein VNN73_16450 [Blastocatellia bacterium]|nr:hypothetical protein [Blastocatellia bacterium]
MLEQDEFDKFVENYNQDYIYLLTRASRGEYHCLISSFTVLKDLYEVILKLHDTLNLEFRVVPYPFSFRASDELLKGFGFSPDQIAKIYGFLNFVKETHGKEFEQILEEGAPIKCVKVGGA